MAPVTPYRPHLLCRESYHFSPHFGTIWGRPGGDLGGFKTVFLWFWGVLKNHKNFKRLVSAPTGLYRHQIKTPGSYRIGLHSDLDMGGFYEALRAPKREKMFL